MSAITLPKVLGLVNSGLHRRPEWGMYGQESLRLKAASKAEREQARGRVGREPGCTQAWVVEFAASRTALEHQSCEIETAPLHMYCLHMIAGGLDPARVLRPFAARVTETLDHLVAIKALQASSATLTHLGRLMLYCNKSPRVSHFLALMLLEHPKQARLLYWAVLEACRLDYGHRPIFVVPRDKPDDTKSLSKQAMQAHQSIPGQDTFSKFQHTYGARPCFLFTFLFADGVSMLASRQSSSPAGAASTLYKFAACMPFGARWVKRRRGSPSLAFLQVEQTIKDLTRRGFCIESDASVPSDAENRILLHALSRAFGISTVTRTRLLSHLFFVCVHLDGRNRPICAAVRSQSSD